MYFNQMVACIKHSIIMCTIELTWFHGRTNFLNIEFIVVYNLKIYYCDVIGNQKSNGVQNKISANHFNQEEGKNKRKFPTFNSTLLKLKIVNGIDINVFKICCARHFDVIRIKISGKFNLIIIFFRKYFAFY